MAKILTGFEHRESVGQVRLQNRRPPTFGEPVGLPGVFTRLLRLPVEEPIPIVGSYALGGGEHLDFANTWTWPNP